MARFKWIEGVGFSDSDKEIMQREREMYNKKNFVFPKINWNSPSIKERVKELIQLQKDILNRGQVNINELNRVIDF